MTKIQTPEFVQLIQTTEGGDEAISFYTTLNTAMHAAELYRTGWPQATVVDTDGSRFVLEHDGTLNGPAWIAVPSDGGELAGDYNEPDEGTGFSRSGHPDYDEQTRRQWLADQQEGEDGDPFDSSSCDYCGAVLPLDQLGELGRSLACFTCMTSSPYLRADFDQFETDELELMELLTCDGVV